MTNKHYLCTNPSILLGKVGLPADHPQGAAVVQHAVHAALRAAEREGIPLELVSDFRRWTAGDLSAAENDQGVLAWKHRLDDATGDKIEVIVCEFVRSLLTWAHNVRWEQVFTTAQDGGPLVVRADLATSIGSVEFLGESNWEPLPIPARDLDHSVERLADCLPLAAQYAGRQLDPDFEWESVS
jgi:hypothetical protein